MLLLTFKKVQCNKYLFFLHTSKPQVLKIIIRLPKSTTALNSVSNVDQILLKTLGKFLKLLQATEWIF